MNKFIALSTLMFCLILSSSAQTAEAILFTENGEKFTAFLNGVQANQAPSVNVSISDLNAEFYQLRVDFEDATLSDMTANISAPLGMQTTYKIKLNNKGKYVARLQSQNALSSQTAAQEAPVTKPDFAVTESTKEVVIEREEAPSSETTTITTTSTQTKPNGEKVEMNVSIDGIQMGVSMNMSGMEMEESETITTTSSSTISTNTGSNGFDVEEEEIIVENISYNGYRGNTGCDFPSQDPGFDRLLSNIKAKDFADSKMTLAKQYANSKCLLAEEVTEIMRTFDFEDDRLEFAQFAYSHTYDQDNYYLVNEAFEFEMTIDELNEYLESKR